MFPSTARRMWWFRQSRGLPAQSSKILIWVGFVFVRSYGWVYVRLWVSELYCIIKKYINLNKPGCLVTWFYTIHIPHYFNPHIVGLDKISSILAESHTSQQVKLNSDHTFGLWPSLVSTLHVRQWTSLVLLLSATFTIIYHVFSIHLFEFLSFQKRRKFSILWQ